MLKSRCYRNFVAGLYYYIENTKVNKGISGYEIIMSFLFNIGKFIIAISL